MYISIFLSWLLSITQTAFQATKPAFLKTQAAVYPRRHEKNGAFIIHYSSTGQFLHFYCCFVLNMTNLNLVVCLKEPIFRLAMLLMVSGITFNASQ